MARILVVEDNAINRRIACRLLEKAGHLADSACNGMDAVTAAKRSAYDLILMDLQMPIMDGLVATMSIRNLENGVRHTPIIALTASDPWSNRDKCLEAGMDGYLNKPIDITQLYQTVDDWITTCIAPVPAN
jgi:two-component system sensor histidine kinase/response regulator